MTRKGPGPAARSLEDGEQEEGHETGEQEENARRKRADKKEKTRRRGREGEREKPGFEKVLPDVGNGRHRPRSSTVLRASGRPGSTGSTLTLEGTDGVAPG
jgi:hypothetical protein